MSEDYSEPETRGFFLVAQRYSMVAASISITRFGSKRGFSFTPFLAYPRRRGAVRAQADQHEGVPQRRAEKAHATEDGVIVVEHTDGGPGAQAFELGHRARDAAAVELVIAGNVEHGLGEPERPRDRLLRAGDVTGQNDRVGLVRGDLQCADGEVQVGEDMQFHRRPPGRAPGELSHHDNKCRTSRTPPERELCGLAATREAETRQGYAHHRKRCGLRNRDRDGVEVYEAGIVA